MFEKTRPSSLRSSMLMNSSLPCLFQMLAVLDTKENENKVVYTKNERTGAGAATRDMRRVLINGLLRGSTAGGGFGTLLRPNGDQ